MTPRVVSIGEAMIEFAPVGEGRYERGFAGDTYNTIWHMAQLLGDRAKCGFATRVGCDRLSDDFVAEAAADGLETSGILRDPARTMGLYLIDLDGGERSFQYWRGEAAARRLADDPDALAGAIDGGSLVHLSGITLAILPPEGREALLAVLARARRSGTKIAFDPNYRVKLWKSQAETRAAVGNMLTLTDIVLPSYDDERTLWSDRSPEATIERFADAGVAEIVVKNGGNGVHLNVDGATTVLETEPAQDIRDTSGAGDSFNAGYLAARLAGQSSEPAVRLGQLLGREVLGHPGARAPKRAVRKFHGHLDRMDRGA